MSEHWALVHGEWDRLSHFLDRLPKQLWTHDSLCAGWSVRDVVAHLCAAARTTSIPWLINMLRSRLDTDAHNLRLMSPYQAMSHEELRIAFYGSAVKMKAPLNSAAGLLSEIVVHGQDMARAVAIDLIPSDEAQIHVAQFMFSKDFSVNSSTLTKDLHLVSHDPPYEYGSGALVEGHLLDLIMAAAGRQASCDNLKGPGAAVMQQRMT